MGAMSSMTEVGIYTVEDLHAFREERDDLTVQLIEGEFIVSPSPSVEHQGVLVELLLVLNAAAPDTLKVFPGPLDLRVTDRTVLQPDLMVIPRSITSGGEVTVPPVLAVEILSPTSRGVDLVRKPDALAAFGVEHYWVIDPLHASLRVFRLEGDADESGLVVTGEERFETDVPFPVTFRPVDLTR